MPPFCDVTDVAHVSAESMAMPMRHLIGEGRGLALYRGMSEAELSALEDVIWQEISDGQQRIAVALRFRALVAVFASRRLRSLLLERGHKVIVAALAVASTERLNTRFGFRAQHMLMLIDRATSTPIYTHQERPLQLAA
jgi:hypothetical protein